MWYGFDDEGGWNQIINRIVFPRNITNYDYIIFFKNKNIRNGIKIGLVMSLIFFCKNIKISSA